MGDTLPGQRATRPAGEPAHSESGRQLPSSRAFIVQLPDGDLGDKPCRGRVEHVRSGRSTRFEDLDRLAQFFATVLSTEGQQGEDEH